MEVKPIFNPPLHQRRHQFVVDFIKRNKTKKVVDLGCNDCTLLHRLKFLHEIELLSGIDINGEVIKKKMRRMAPLPADYLQPGDRPLSIELYQGSVTQRDSRLRGFDLVTSIELIEHLQLTDVELFSEVVFGFMAPVWVIVTTPNSEFNPLLPGLVGFRHYDHKFEWTRAEFQTWALKACEEYGYEVYFTGVGQPPPGQQASFGFCSQIGVFQRLCTTENACVMPSSDADEVFSYTLLYSVAYPSLRDNNILQGVVVNEVIYWTERLRMERMEEEGEASQVQAGGYDASVPLVQLWSCCPKVQDLCGTLSHFRQLLLDHPLVTLTQDASAVLIHDQHQAPCVPSNVEAVELCEDNGAVVSWAHSVSATSFLLTATGRNGDLKTCNTSVNNCTLSGLDCGQPYNFSVIARAGDCTTQPSAAVSMETAPCPPTNITTKLQFMSDDRQWIRVYWEKLDCELQYLVELTGRINNDTEQLIKVMSYWVDRKYFEIPLPCSTAYSMTIRSRNSAGEGKPSVPMTGITAPCAPQGVSYSGSVLSWDASVFATQYNVYNGSRKHNVTLCSTTDLSCNVADLVIGATELTASNAEGESQPTTIIAGPIVNRRRRELPDGMVEMAASLQNKNLEIPTGLTLSVTGTSIYVEWSPVVDATDYIVIVKKEGTPGLFKLVTVVGQESCTVGNLESSTKYCVSIKAKNAMQDSTISKSTCITTETTM